MFATEEKMKEWICSCGHINSGNFCGNCGKPKRTLTIKKIPSQSHSSGESTAEQAVERSILAEISTVLEFDDGNSSSSKETTTQPVNKKKVSESSKAIKRDKSELRLSEDTLLESSSTSRPVKTKSRVSKNSQAQSDEKKNKSQNHPPQEATEATSQTRRTAENVQEQNQKTVVYAPPSAPPNNFMQRNRPRYYFDDESLFSLFRKDPKEFLIQRKDIFIKAFVFFLFFMLTSFNFGGSGKRVNTKPPVPVTNQETTTPAPIVTTVPAKPYQLPSTVDMHNVSSELSLGAICLGDSLERVHAIIGSQERIYDNNDGFIRHHYPDMEVVVKNNIVEALVSKTAKVETKRGLHQNSTRQDVITTYGRDYELSEMNGNTLLEYPFISLHGKKSLLRFALKNEVVEYISVRTISDEQQKPKPAEQEDGSMQVFRQYWDKLNSRDFAGAYNLMTDKQQNQMGEFENYRSGYNEMIENSLTDARILEKADNFVRISYTLQAKDRVNGQIKVQIFQGNAVMVKLADGWKIDNLEAKLVRAFNE